MRSITTITKISSITTIGAVVALLVGGCAANDDAADRSSPTISERRDAAIHDTATSVAPAPTAAPATAPDTAPDTITPAITSDATGPPARLGVADDEFATRLSAAHTTMIDVSAPIDARQRAGIDFQLVLRELADRGELDGPVLDALDPSARPAVERIVVARQFLQQRSASRPAQPAPDDLPAWTIVDPEPVDTLLAHYAEAEQLTGIPWYWLAAIHLQETRMGRIQGVSSAAAVGPMQFLTTTWEACCTGDPTVTRDAIIGAATYLAQSGGPGDMAAAVYQYNPNDGYVAVVTAYAESLRDEPELYTGYHAFQVFFGTSAGTVRLPIGYSQTTAINAATYLAAHPQDAA